MGLNRMAAVRSLTSGPTRGHSPLWATQRRSWRDHDVKIDGDERYATRFLDAVRVV